MLRPRLRRSGGVTGASSDELSDIPFPSWDRFADGSLRRLKRGKHYTGNPAILLHEAKVAAEQQGKRAVSHHDRLGKFEYVWLQFLDGPLAPDAHCPHCQGREMEQTQEYFLRCLNCGSLYTLRDKRPTTTAAQFLGTSVLSPDGTEIEEIRVGDEAVVEALCEFHRPVAVAHVSFVFSSGGRRALVSGCPDLIEVPTADTVRIRLNLDGSVLSVGRYTMFARLELVLDEKDRRLHGFRSRGRTRFHVVDPTHPSERGPGGERSRLHWSAVSAVDGSSMPVFDIDEPEDATLEDDEIDAED